MLVNTNITVWLVTIMIFILMMYKMIHAQYYLELADVLKIL